MANDKSFKIKNGLKAGRYLGSNGTETAGSEGYSLAGASYGGGSFNTLETSGPTGSFFKPDGTKMYVASASGDNIYQYTLSTSWDISTASYDSVSFNLTAQDGTPEGISFNSDGTTMYVLGANNDTIFQYTLSTAYDISTASYASKSLSLSSQDTGMQGFYIKPDGSSLFSIGVASDAVYQYSLSTPFDVSTGSFASKSFSAASQDTVPRGLAFNNNGTKMFIAGEANDAVYQYSLSTSWDVTTASYDSISFSVTSQTNSCYDIAFSSSGDNMYITSLSASTIYQYSTVGYTQTLDLATGGTFSFTPSGATTVSFTNPPASGTATGFALEVVNTGGYTITWPSSVKWHLGAAPTATATKELYTFVTTDGGTTYYGKLAGSDIA
jgi:sugar lactone lactonase YvrE